MYKYGYHARNTNLSFLRYIVSNFVVRSVLNPNKNNCSHFGNIMDIKNVFCQSSTCYYRNELISWENKLSASVFIVFSENEKQYIVRHE